MSRSLTSTDVTPEGSSRERFTLLSTATFSQFGASVMQQGTVVLGVFFALTYHLTLPQMGLVIASLTIGLTLSGLGAGPAVDRWGSRRLLLVGAAILTACSTAIAFSSSLGVTVVLLFIIGLALGSVPLSGTKAIMMAWPRERRGLPTGIRQSGVPLGALVTSLILPTIAAHVGLKPIYAGFAALIACSSFLFCAVLPEQTVAPARQDTTITRVELKRLIIPCICGFLLAWGQYALLTYTIPMLQRNGLSIAIGGALLALAQVGGAAARFALGAISDRVYAGRREPVLLGCAIAGAVFGVMLAFLPHAAPLWALALLWLGLGGAYVGWNALALTWAGELVVDARAGSAIGLETSAVLTGASITTPVFGAVVERSGSFSAGWLLLAAIMTVAAILLWVQTRRPDPSPYALESSDTAALAAESSAN